jgi:hypothetical protein
MSDMKWQLNHSYRLVYVREFLDSSPYNSRIYEVIKDNVFEVTAMTDSGNPAEILVSGRPFTMEDFGMYYIFYNGEIDYFYHVEDVVSTTQTATVIPLTQVNHFIAEWLGKLAYIVQTDPTVGSCLDVNLRAETIIDTDHGSIIGNHKVVDFVDTRYTELKVKEDTKRKSELEEKRLKVLDELSKIDQELDLYNT